MTQMYNISNYDPGAFLTNLKNEALQKYNQQMGASGTGADIAVKTASLPTRIKTGIQSILPNKNLFELSNLGQLAKVPEIDQLGLEYGLTEQPEKVNLARHAAASRELANTLTPNIPGGRYIGNTLSFLGGLAEEGSDLAKRGIMEAGPEVLTDIVSNYKGLKYPTGTTAREVYEDIYSEPQEGLVSLPEVQPTYTYDPEQLDYYDDPENNPYINHMGLATFGNRPISFEPLNYNIYDAGSAGLPVYAPDFTSAEQANKFYGAYRFYNRNNPELLEQYGLQY